MNTTPPRRATRRLAAILAAVIAWAAGVLWMARPSAADVAFLQDFALSSAVEFLNGSFYRTGIVNNAGGEVQLLPIGVAGNWITDTQQLPAPRAQHAVATVGNRVYAVGGLDDQSLPTRFVYSSTVIGTNLTGWVTQSASLPVELAGHTALGATAGGNNYLYVLGGYLGSTFAESNKIYYAPVNPNGSLGAWITNTVDLPLPLTFSSAVVHDNRIYLVGGIGAGLYRAEAYSAPLNGDGSVGGWSAQPALPQTLARTATVVFRGVLSNTVYVLGGTKDGVNNSPEVYFADILPGGALTPWRASTGILPEAFNSHAALQAAGQIYIIGGNTGGIGANELPRKIVLSALVDESNSNRRLLDFGGGQSSWVETEPLPIPRREHGAAYVNGELFAIGGNSSNLSGMFAPSRLSYHGPTTGAGSKYAPNGNYLSPVINSGGAYQFAELAFSTVMTNVSALTITVRYHTSTDGISWGPWSAMLPANRTQSAHINDPKSITHTLNTPGQYFQYQAYFTTTSNVATPFFLESHLKVNIPPPDLTVRKTAATSNAVPGSIISYTIAYTNQGGYLSSGARLTETRPANTTYVDTGAGWVQVDGTRFVKTLPDIPVGGTGIVPFSVQVDNSLPPGTFRVTNTIQIGGDALETNFANNSFELGTSVLPQLGVDLRVTDFGDGISNPTAGQTVSYTVGYFNYGTDAAPGSALTITLPAGMSGSALGGWIGLGGGMFRLELGTIGSAQGGSAGFGAQVGAGVAGASFLTTTVRVGHEGIDVVPNNNDAADVDYVSPGNLSLTKDDGYALVDLNQTLVYTLTYGNHGGAVVANTEITETPALALVNVLDNPGWTLSGNEYVRSIGAVPPGASGYVTFAVQVKASAATGALITNTARIGAATDDPGQLTDNQARDVDKVQPGGGPDLRILGVRAPETVYLFQPATFYITVTNSGSLGTGDGFYLDLYVDNMPLTRSDLGQYHATNGPLVAGEVTVVPLTLPFDALGLRNVWFQVDTCDQCAEPSYGRVMETLENNNVFGPIVIEVQQFNIYLPVLRR